MPGPLYIEGGIQRFALGKSLTAERGIRGDQSALAAVAAPGVVQPARKALQTVASPTLYARASAAIVSPFA